ncbi:MAG: porin family protein [Acidobacteriales bacterium]|nr:porin family protein [Terriglobales bacterium]
MMKRLGCIVALLAWVSCSVHAQVEAPKVEVFGGYSYNTFGNIDPGLHGWNASGTWNVNRWLGLTADFGGNYGERTLTLQAPPAGPLTLAIRDRQHTFLLGPRVSLRKARFTLFAHGLVGAAVTQLRTTAVSPPGPTQSITDTNFSYALGGGFDLHVSPRVALRLVQADYLYTKPFGSDRDSFRVSAGAVFRFGSR